MGAAAIRRRSLRFADLHRSFRKLSDVDFVTYSEQLPDIERSMAEIGFKNRPAGLTPEIFSKRRILFYEKNGETLWTDIFADHLEMNHIIDYRGRLELEYPTTPLAELFLQKSQIVMINEKDLKDLCILLLEHEVDGRRRETIDGQYIADVLSKDWGFNYTVTTNLEKLRRLMERWSNIFDQDQLKIIRERSEKLRNEIEQKEKTLRWKLRAKVGAKTIWYNQVEEVERAPVEF